MPIYYGQRAHTLRAMCPYITGNMPIYYGQRAHILWAACPGHIAQIIIIPMMTGTLQLPD